MHYEEHGMDGDSSARRHTPKRLRWQRSAAMDREILDVEGAATLLGVSPRTIYALARNGQISAMHVGLEWRFARQNCIA